LVPFPFGAIAKRRDVDDGQRCSTVQSKLAWFGTAFLWSPNFCENFLGQGFVTLISERRNNYHYDTNIKTSILNTRVVTSGTLPTFSIEPRHSSIYCTVTDFISVGWVFLVTPVTSALQPVLNVPLTERRENSSLVVNQPILVSAQNASMKFVFVEEIANFVHWDWKLEPSLGLLKVSPRRPELSLYYPSPRILQNKKYIQKKYFLFFVSYCHVRGCVTDIVDYLSSK